MTKFLLISIVVIIGIVIIGWFFFASPQTDIESSFVCEKTAKAATQADSSPSSIPLEKVFTATLTDYQGNSVNILDFVGKPLVLNSWAAWCPFCRKELPDFATVQQDLGSEVLIVAIDRAESLQTAKRYSDELGVTDDFMFLLDPKDSFYRAIGGFSMPETLFVDREGNIVFHKRGPMEVEEICSRTQALL